MEVENPPAWSMPGRPRTVQVTDCSAPGPGTYEVPGTFTKPTYSVSRTNRFTPGEVSGPGPGSYNPSPLPSKASQCLTQASKGLKFQIIDAPGPGVYNPELPAEGASFCMRGRTADRVPQGQPGPGEYVSKLGVDTPQYKFGSSTRPAFKPTDSPGPGTYESGGRSSMKAAVFAKGNRLASTGPPQLPGPGSYRSFDFSDAPQFSMRSRVNQPKPKGETPGPGTYESSLKQQGKSFSVAKSSRFEGTPDKTPGPGTYRTATLEKSRNVALGASKKIEKFNSNPAPGTYEVKPTNEGKAFTMNGRHSNQEPEKLPGPGSYTGKQPRKHDGNTVFGRDRRASRTASNCTPGPGAYTFYDDQGKLFRFGTGRRYASTANSGPGPADYTIRSTVGNRLYTTN